MHPLFVRPSSGGLGGHGVTRRPCVWQDDDTSLSGGIPLRTLPGEGETRILSHAHRESGKPVRNTLSSCALPEKPSPVRFCRINWLCDVQPKEDDGAVLASSGDQHGLAVPGAVCSVSRRPFSNGADLREPRCFLFLVQQ